MNVTELRTELKQHAEEVDAGIDLVPAAQRRGRAAQRLRIGAAAASVALVTAASVTVAPGLLRGSEPAPAAGPAAIRAPLLSVIDPGRPVELSPGVRFTITGKKYRITGQAVPGTNATIRPSSYGEQGIHIGALPGDRLHSLNIFPGNAVRVVYSVRLPGASTATEYDADVYRLTSAPGWTLAYVVYPANGLLAEPGPKPSFEQNLAVTYTAYGAAGNVIPHPTPR